MNSNPLQDATDIGPAPTPPAWCEPGAQPDWGQLTEQHGGYPVAFWCRTVSHDVYIGCEDYIVGSRLLRSPARIYADEADGIDTTEARRLAAMLVEAADELDRRQ